MKKSKCLIELIHNFTRQRTQSSLGDQSPKKSSNYYEIVAEIKEDSNYSGYSQYSFVSKTRQKDNDQVPYVVSIKLMEVIHGESKFIVVSIADLSKLQNLSFKIIQTNYQKILTNALSHERMTPLNAIINGCEKIYR